MTGLPSGQNGYAKGRWDAAEEEMIMTLLRFSGGEAVSVHLSLADLQKLLQEAIRKNALLEIDAPNGTTLVINPQQVQYLQEADEADPELFAEVSSDDRSRVPAGA